MNQVGTNDEQIDKNLDFLLLYFFVGTDTVVASTIVVFVRFT